MNNEPGISFRLAGIPVRIDASFLLLLLVLASWQRGTPAVLVWFACATAGVLVHELGHALTVRAYGFSPSIRLYGFGGLTTWHPPIAWSRWKRILVTLAGPGAGFALGLVVFAVRQYVALDSMLAEQAVTDLTWVTVGWGLLNLLPVLPLDGGQVVATLLEPLPGAWPLHLSLGVSTLTWVVLSVFCLARHSYFNAALAAWFAWTNARSLQQALGSGPASAGLTPPPKDPRLEQSYELLNRGLPDEAIARAREILAGTPSAWERSNALAAIANVHLSRRDEQAALEVLLTLPAGFSLPPHLEAELLIQADWPEVALEALERNFARTPDAHTGHLILLALLEQGRLDEAIERSQGALGQVCCAEFLRNVARAAERAGRLAQSAAVGTVGFERKPDPQSAYAVSCSLCRLGRLDEAVHWFARAVDAGLKRSRHVELDPDLAPLRTRPDFLAAWARLASASRPEGPRDFSGWTLRRAGSQASPARPSPLSASTQPLRDPLPLLFLRSAVLLPTELKRVAVVTAPSIAAVEAALGREGQIGVMAWPRSAKEPDSSERPRIGVVARIRRSARIARGILLVELEGLTRFKASRFDEAKQYPGAVSERLGDEAMPGAAAADQVEELRRLAGELLPRIPDSPLDAADRIAWARSPGTLTDAVATALSLPVAQKEKVLLATEVGARLSLVRELVEHERQAVAAIPAARCPCCAWEPPAEARWMCGCGRRFNTFAARGECPGCGHRFPLTWCLRCSEPSLHRDWYTGEPRPSVPIG